MSSTSTSSDSSPYSVPNSPQLIPPSTPPGLIAANYYKDHQQQQQQSTSSRTPVIQFGPKIAHQNHNKQSDGASPLSFSVNNLLHSNVISDEPNLRITIASEHLLPPPLVVATSGSGSGNLASSPKLAPSDNVPPLIPLRSTTTPSVQISVPKYMQIPGDLSIDEDYDN